MKRRGPICSGEQQTRQADVNKQGLAITTRTGAMPRMFTRRRFWLPALVLVAAGSVLACFALQRRVTLREMLQVQMGMGKLEVQQILGRPDIIELESGQDHWLYRGSPESSEQRLPGQAFYWVVVFDAAGNELGWDDETRIDNSLHSGGDDSAAQPRGLTGRDSVSKWGLHLFKAKARARRGLRT